MILVHRLPCNLALMKTALRNRQTLSIFFLFGVSVLSPAISWAQDNGKPTTPGPDTLIFVDGEKLIGHLLRSTGNSVVFHSDMAGEVTIDWSNIKELTSTQKFAVVEKGVKLRTNESDAKIPQGSVSLQDGNLRVQTSAAEAAFGSAPDSNRRCDRLADI